MNTPSSSIGTAGLDRVAETWVSDMTRVSLQGALLIAAVWGICRLFPRIPASVRCCLWWLACAKLLVSLVWTSPVKLAVLPPSWEKYVSASSLPGFRGGAQASRAALSDSTRQPIVAPAADRRGWYSGMRQARLASILICLWSIGLLVRLGMIAAQFLAIRCIIWRTGSLRRTRIGEEVRRLGLLLGLRSPPPVQVSRLITSPLVVGLLRPIVLLPETHATRLSEEELRVVLAHELAHVRRRDLWLGLVPILTQTLFFFHPLVWLACREFAMSREEACDAEAMRLTGTLADAYARILLKLGVSRHEFGAGAALGVAPGYRLLKRRLLMLQYVSPRSHRPVQAGLVLMIALGGICLVPWRLVAVPAAPRPRLSARPSALALRMSRHEGSQHDRVGSPARVHPSSATLMARTDAARTMKQMVRSHVAAEMHSRQVRRPPVLDLVWEVGTTHAARHRHRSIHAAAHVVLDIRRHARPLHQKIARKPSPRGLARVFAYRVAKQTLPAQKQTVRITWKQAIRMARATRRQVARLVRQSRHAGTAPQTDETATDESDVPTNTAAGEPDPNPCPEATSDRVRQELRRQGIPQAWVAGLKDLGYGDLTICQYERLWQYNVKPVFIQDLQQLGYEHLTVCELMEMSRRDVTVEYVQALHGLGYDHLSPADLIKLRRAQITPEFIQSLKDSGKGLLSVRQLVRLRRQGSSDS